MGILKSPVSGMTINSAAIGKRTIPPKRSTKNCDDIADAIDNGNGEVIWFRFSRMSPLLPPSGLSNPREIRT